MTFSSPSLEASIVSRISSKLCFRISPLTFLWSYMSPHIQRVSIRALVSDDIFGFFVCFAMLIALCWIISVMFSFTLSMSSRHSCDVNLFLVSRRNVFFFIRII